MANRKIVSFDWAIKNILRDKANFGILEGFLFALLKKSIKIEELIESESNQSNGEMKFNRVDLLAVDENGEHIIIEVQYSPEQSYFKRLLYGTSKDIVDNIKTGEDYSHVKKVYSISLVYFSVERSTSKEFPSDYIYHGRTDFVGLHSGKRVDINSNFLVGYDSNTKEDINIFPEYFVISLSVFDDNVKDELDEWTYSFKNHEVKDSFSAPGIKEMGEKLDYVAMEPQAQRNYDKYLLDLASDRGTLEFNTKKAKAEGHTEGHAEGRLEEKIAALKEIFKMGLSIEQASKITGLTVSDIEELNIGF